MSVRVQWYSAKRVNQSLRGLRDGVHKLDYWIGCLGRPSTALKKAEDEEEDDLKRILSKNLPGQSVFRVLPALSAYSVLLIMLPFLLDLHAAAPASTDVGWDVACLR